MSKLKSCYRRSQQPGYFADVELDGEVIATVKAMTRFDLSELQRRVFEKETPDMVLYSLIRLRQALTGNDKVGLKFTDDKVDEELINDLSNDVFNAISKAVNDLDNNWEDQREALEKN